MSVRRYAAVGAAVIVVALTLVTFSGDSFRDDPDVTGIVCDIRESTNGFTFTLITHDGEVRCFSQDRPVELSYVGVSGSYSDDGGILFVERLTDLERRASRPHRYNLVTSSRTEGPGCTWLSMIRIP